jgi:L-2-hydroxyglutarate oxidase
MDALFDRAKQNNIVVERLDEAELGRREPNVRGLGALFVPSTGIVDYTLVCEAMARVIEMGGGKIELNAQVTAIRETGSEVEIHAGERRWTAEHLVACAGLQSDRLARLAGLNIEHQIVPFRGEYYRLPPGKNDIIHHLIYPIPDPELPFLGIHLTRMIDGGVTVGPNAVLGLSREGYDKFSFDMRDMLEYAGFVGFWRTVAKYRNSAVAELSNSLSKARYLEECRRYCPSLTLSDLLPHQAGIRAQAVARDGTLMHDFLFVETARMLHVCNAPSPGATSSLPIGDMIARKAIGELAQVG